MQTCTVVVANSTLKIRLYWAGQGTTGIIGKGVYGPLISAISVYNPGKLSSFELHVSCLNDWESRHKLYSLFCVCFAFIDVKEIDTDVARHVSASALILFSNV
ncbi:hypothetical protein ACSBR1_012023 [Camellia fascicularis]